MLTMQDFRRMVNREVVAVCGIGMDCLSDFDLYNYYDPDLSDDEARTVAAEAAHDLLEEEGFPLTEEDY